MINIMIVQGLFWFSLDKRVWNYNWFDSVERINKKFIEEYKKRKPKLIIGHSEGGNIVLNNIDKIDKRCKIILLVPVIYKENIRLWCRWITIFNRVLRLDLRDKLKKNKKRVKVVYVKNDMDLIKKGSCKLGHNAILRHYKKRLVSE